MPWTRNASPPAHANSRQRCGSGCRSFYRFCPIEEPSPVRTGDGSIRYFGEAQRPSCCRSVARELLPTAGTGLSVLVFSTMSWILGCRHRKAYPNGRRISAGVRPTSQALRKAIDPDIRRTAIANLLCNSFRGFTIFRCHHASEQRSPGKSTAAALRLHSRSIGHNPVAFKMMMLLNN